MLSSEDNVGHLSPLSEAASPPITPLGSVGFFAAIRLGTECGRDAPFIADPLGSVFATEEPSTSPLRPRAGWQIRPVRGVLELSDPPNPTQSGERPGAHDTDPPAPKSVATSSGRHSLTSYAISTPSADRLGGFFYTLTDQRWSGRLSAKTGRVQHVHLLAGRTTHERSTP